MPQPHLCNVGDCPEVPQSEAERGMLEPNLKLQAMLEWLEPLQYCQRGHMTAVAEHSIAEGDADLSSGSDHKRSHMGPSCGTCIAVQRQSAPRLRIARDFLQYEMNLLHPCKYSSATLCPLALSTLV